MADVETKSDDIWAPWRRRIDAANKRRDELIGEWQENVARRRGKPSEAASTGQIAVNQDWPLTKAKIAQLYSQTPEVRLSIRSGQQFQQFSAAVHDFGKELNDTITDVSVGSTIEENLSDVSNASGIAGVIVTCDTKTVTAEVPMGDPSLGPSEMMPVETVADVQYRADRISPADLLIPSDFTGSNYDHARWLGHKNRMTWAQAVGALGLTEEQKDDVLGADNRSGGTTGSLNTDTLKFRDTEVVNYTEVFYWRHFYHADETNFHALQRIVFVEGLDEPVVDEPYKVQQRTEDGQITGVRKNPIRILTLTYISDDAMPPSDSSISRYQVNELEQSRSDMVLQRKHSIPMRWGDTNRISPNTKTKLDQGEYQSIIWTNGPGERALGEVARASFPPEKFEFDKIIKSDLTELWQVGSNQAGAFASGERSAREAGIIEKNFQRRVGQEQDKVQKFFLGIAEVLAGHLAMYGGNPLGPMLANAFVYSVRVDDTVRKDADEQIERLTKGLNLTAQSGFVNVKPVIAKIWSLLGENPDEIVIDPQPKSPEPIKISISSAEDLVNPLMLAHLGRTGQLATPADMSAVVKLLAQIGAIPGLAALLVPPPEPQGDPNAPPREVETPGISHPDWEAAPRIERRAADGAV